MYIFELNQFGKLVEDYSSLKDFNYCTLFLIYENGRGMPHDDTLNMFGRGLMCLPYPVILPVETFACSWF